MKGKALVLPLKAQWYEMIESGIKQEEYREIKEYWIKKFIEHQLGKIPFVSNNTRFKEFDLVEFHYGYTSRVMLFELESIKIGVGNPEWGAPKENVFILKLGKRIK